MSNIVRLHKHSDEALAKVSGGNSASQTLGGGFSIGTGGWTHTHFSWNALQCIVFADQFQQESFEEKAAEREAQSVAAQTLHWGQFDPSPTSLVRHRWAQQSGRTCKINHTDCGNIPACVLVQSTNLLRELELDQRWRGLFLSCLKNSALPTPPLAHEGYITLLTTNPQSTQERWHLSAKLHPHIRAEHIGKADPKIDRVSQKCYETGLRKDKDVGSLSESD